MKALFALSALLVAACTSMPSSPESAGCGAFPSCGATARNGGLSADKTVQLMVQSPMLIGGKAADPEDWPASVYAKAGNSACSATLVGDRVLLVASHCVSNGGSMTFTAHANSYKAACTHHPEYKKNATADWTLCLVDRPVTGVAFENLGIRQNVEMGQNLTLTGYGCIKPGGGGGNDGIFRVGTATVKGLPSGPTYDIVTKGGAALCFGDSGGAAYLVDSDGKRVIVGVNSRGDISSMSYLPAIASVRFWDWATDWAKNTQNVKLCGIHSEATGCRTPSPGPMPDGKFELMSKAACVKGMVKPEYLQRKSEIVGGIQKALDQF